MAFQPRLKEDGTACCYRILEHGGMAFPPNACQPCKDFAAGRQRAAVLRTAQEGRVTFPKHTCQRCRDAAHDGNTTLRTTEHQEEPMTHQEQSMTYAPPDPYRGLAALKAASAAPDTPESTFEEAWKATRRRDFDAERFRRDAATAATPRLKTLTAEELSPYSAPSGYDIAIRAQKLMEKAR